MFYIKIAMSSQEKKKICQEYYLCIPIEPIESFRSCARGMGIATLAMHHGTVLGDGPFVYVGYECHCCHSTAGFKIGVFLLVGELPTKAITSSTNPKQYARYGRLVP